MEMNWKVLFLSLILKTIAGDNKDLLSEIDVLSTLDYEFYILPRVRWGELNSISGYRSSEKLLKYKKVQTGIGEMQVPVEDFSKMGDLSESEYLSILNTKPRIDTEEDTNLGLELLDEGEYGDAVEILENVRDRIAKEFGKDHVLYGNALADLGWAQYVQKHYEQAIEFYSEATQVDETFQEQYGAKNYAASSNMLAICSIKAGKRNIYAISSVLEKGFHALLEASDAERHKILLNLANIYLSDRMPIRAIAILKLARHVLKQTKSELVNDVYVYLGTAYMMKQEYARAEKLLNMAKKGYESQRVVEKNPFYIEALYQLAYNDLLMGKPEAAFRQLSIVKDMYEELKGPSTPQSALIICTMGQALRQAGETTKAIMFLETASSVATKDASAKTSLVDLRISVELTELYKELGDKEKLGSQLRNTVEMGTHLLGEDHSLVLQYKTDL